MTRAIGSILFLAAACVHAEEEWLSNSEILSCAPAVIGAGEVLKLSLGRGHGQELAIQGPREQQIFLLVVGSPPEGDPQLMTTQEFAAATEVTLTTEQVARPWVLGAKLEKVFSTPGTYTISVSDNLESEAGGFQCTVKYTG